MVINCFSVFIHDLSTINNLLNSRIVLNLRVYLMLLDKMYINT